MTRTIRWALAMALTAAAPAAAQPAPPLALTLDEAIVRALEAAPRIAEARAREAAGDAVVASRRAAGLPSVTTTAGYLRTNHVDEFGVAQPDGGFRVLFPDIPSNYRVRLEMSAPLFTGGRVEAGLAGARAESRAAAADRQAVEADVRFDVTRAYWTAVTTREAVRVLVQALERTDAAVADVRARVDVGLLPPNELLSAQAQRARQSVRLIEARNAAAFATMDLARLIGAAVSQPIDPVTAVDTPLAGVGDLIAAPPDDLVDRAIAARPERAGLTERQGAWQHGAEASRAATRPQIGLVAAVEPARPNQRFVPRMDEWRTSWDLGVQMTWPLFDGGRARADRAAATAQADAIGHRLREFDAVVAVDVRQRLLELDGGRAALAAAGEAVAAAAEARRVVDERFRAGVATSTDVLDAQVSLLESELERTRLAAALRLGEARLLRVVGGR